MITQPTGPTLPPKPRSRRLYWLGLFAAVLVLALTDMRISLSLLSGALWEVGEYMSRYSDPDFGLWREYVLEMGETLAMALWSTVACFVFAVALAPFAARNLAPNPIVYRATRELFNFMRAIPDLLMAVIFVAMIGLGPMAGVAALTFHTTGFLGKFLAENLERVDRGTYEALTASGADMLQRVHYAGWPSVAREAAGYALFIFDRNVRMAAVLGLVGAGGIGITLFTTIRLFEYRQAAAVVLIILGTILAVDYASSWLRSRMQ